MRLRLAIQGRDWRGWGAQVRPTLARLQATLLAAGGALVLGSGLLLSLVLGSADADGVYGAP